jgi:iron(III) transport system substrate-binding protein
LLHAGRLASLPASVRAVPGWHGAERRWVALTLRGRGLHTRLDSGLSITDIDWNQLADTRWRGRVCMRTSANVYQRSMLALLIVQRGEEAARRWARDVVANFARSPAAGDYAQLTDLAEGRCALGVANHSYALWLRHEDTERKALAPQVASAPMAAALPNPGWGAVVTGSRQPALAAALLDFLLDAQVNAAYAAASHEYPVVPEAALLSSQVRTLGPWRPAPPDWPALLAALPRADAVFAEVGWK